MTIGQDQVFWGPLSEPPPSSSSSGSSPSSEQPHGSRPRESAAAIAAGNPVIAKANSSHPGTTRRFAVEAAVAAKECGLPRGTVQLIYRTSHADGERFVADSRVGAIGYTGSRSAGLKLKEAADRAGRPIYLELSSVNPVVILPGALNERFDDVAQQFTSSCLMGTGQFCTNPGLVILLDDEKSRRFVDRIAEQFRQAPVGTLLSKSVEANLAQSVKMLVDAGAKTVAGDGASASRADWAALSAAFSAGRSLTVTR